MKTYFDKNPSEYLDQLMDAQDSDLLLKNAKKNLELMKKNFDLIIKKINDYNNENVNKNEINFKDSLSINKNKIDYIDNIKSYTHKMQFQAHISKYLEVLLNKRKEWFSIFIKKYVDNCMNNLRDILTQTNTISNFIEDENTPQIKASFCLKGINEIKEIISNLEALNGYLLDYNSYCNSKISPIVVLMFYYHNFADGGFTNKINKAISYFKDELGSLEIRYNNYNISTENIPNKKEITEKIVWNGTYNQLIQAVR